MVAQRRSSLCTLARFVACVCMVAPVDVRAQASNDRMLSTVSVAEKAGCAVVKIDFNGRIQYQSHFPAAVGDEVRIQINPLDKTAGDLKTAAVPEALRAPSSERAAIHAIEFERAAGASQALKIYFKRNVAFKIAQGIDFKSVLIAISEPGGTASCSPDPAVVATGPVPPSGNGLRSSMFEAQKAKAAVAAAPVSARDAVQLVVDARAALDKNNADRAVQLLTKVIDAGESAYRQEAQELLGGARERRGQIAHAKAEYQDYLVRYTQGPGVERVRARLAAIDDGAKPASGVAPLPPAASQGVAVVGAGPKIDLGGATRAGSKGVDGSNAATTDGTRILQPVKSPDAWTILPYGSLSTFYNLNQGGSGFIQAPRTNVGWDRENPYQTYQSAFLSNFDYDVRFDNASYGGRFKFSASQQNNLIAQNADETRISSLYFEGRLKDSGLSAIIGRQSATTGGVLGRFDGGVFTYQATDAVKVGFIAGSPVELSSQTPFASRSSFYGASADMVHFGHALETTGYVIEQRTDGMVDRQALGLEARYVRDASAGYGAVEYDIHFGEINSTVFTGNTMFADQSSASINLDYRRAPILLSSNALLGQGVYTLTDLLRRYSGAEIDRLAVDRTAQSYTGTGSYSKPLNSWLQWSSDLTLNYLTGTPASGGVDAVASTGMAYYASSQLSASGVFNDGDNVSGGLRYANTLASDRYMLELGMNYPINQDWRVNPTLRFGYAVYKTEPRNEYQVIPSVRTTYAARPDTMLELELGGRLGITNSPIGKEIQNEFLVLAGIRYDLTPPR